MSSQAGHLALLRLRSSTTAYLRVLRAVEPELEQLADVNALRDPTLRTLLDGVRAALREDRPGTPAAIRRELVVSVGERVPDPVVEAPEVQPFDDNAAWATVGHADVLAEALRNFLREFTVPALEKLGSGAEAALADVLRALERQPLVEPVGTVQAVLDSLDSLCAFMPLPGTYGMDR